MVCIKILAILADVILDHKKKRKKFAISDLISILKYVYAYTTIYICMYIFLMQRCGGDQQQNKKRNCSKENEAKSLKVPNFKCFQMSW